MKKKNNEFKEKIVALAKIHKDEVSIKEIKKEPLSIIDIQKATEVVVPYETKEEKEKRIKAEREKYLGPDRKRTSDGSPGEFRDL